MGSILLHMIRIILIFLAALICVKADELVGAKAEYAKQDKALNGIYGKLKKELDPAVFTKVQASQRDWVEYRDYMADWQAHGEEPEASVERWILAAGLTESRVEWLGAWLRQKERKGWEGVYQDSYGGTLRIVEKEGNYWFSVDVVRGPTFHLGEIGGEFRVKGGTGWFEVKSEGDEESTWLTFLQANDGSGQVKVVGENTMPYHGARAYFDGDYLWVGELAEKDRKDVIAGKSRLED